MPGRVDLAFGQCLVEALVAVAERGPARERWHRRDRPGAHSTASVSSNRASAHLPKQS